jgi:hypothetical protein
MYVQKYLNTNGKGVVPITPDVHHDLEAAIYVFIYAVARHELEAARRELEKQDPTEARGEELPARQHELQVFVQSTFGADSYTTMTIHRRAIATGLPDVALKRTRLLSLMQTLARWVSAQNVIAYRNEADEPPVYRALAREPVLLRADWILTRLDKTIREIQQEVVA